MQKYRNRMILGLGIALLIYIVTLIVLDNSGQFSEEGVLDALGRFPAWLYIPLILCQVAAGAFRFWEWHYYLAVIDARDKISLKDSAIIFTASFMMVVSPGKVAEILKSVFLKMKTGVAVAISAPIVIAERVVDGLAVIVIMFLVLIFASEQLNLGNYRGLSEGVIYSSAALIGFGLVAVQIAPLAYFCLNILGAIPLVKRLKAPLTEFYESSREIFKLKHVIPTSIMGVGVYLSTTAGFILILWGYGVEVTGALCLQAAFMVGVASAIGALSFIPNGAGVTEISNAAMLAAITAPANPELTLPVITAVALLQGFFHKWLRVLVGMGVAFIYRDRLFTSDLDAELVKMDHHTPQTEQVKMPVS